MSSIVSGTVPVGSGASLLRQFEKVRATTLRLVAPLSAEDAMLQSMGDASPAKWHLAHTTWFFETFILAEQLAGYRAFNPEFRILFNSYYKTLGSHPLRQTRGGFSRPSLSQVLRYREHVDEAVRRLLEQEVEAETLGRIELGIHHEQQHQELILTDILHGFWSQPLRPVYAEQSSLADATGDEGTQAAEPLRWVEHQGGTVESGAEGEGFAFDNERPRHAVLLRPYRLGSRLTTSGEYLEFIEDKGYERAELWLSDGWDTVCREGWRAPLYWEREGDEWRQFTLRGMRAVNLAAPVCHVSYYEADAFARWKGARLPLEAEWEAAAARRRVAGNLLESWTLGTCAAEAGGYEGQAGVVQADEVQMYGDVWEWTGSAYLGYPGFRPAAGAVGEYNGKFMCNQFVLRGGSFATAASHIRASYRNFFPPHVRWQFMGIRLASDEE